VGVSYVNALSRRIAKKYREQQKAICRRKVHFPNYDACAKWCSPRTVPYECPWCRGWHRTHRKPSHFPMDIQDQMASEVLKMFR